jgi:hypothetical protein
MRLSFGRCCRKARAICFFQAPIDDGERYSYIPDILSFKYLDELFFEEIEPRLGVRYQSGRIVVLPLQLVDPPSKGSYPFRPGDFDSSAACSSAATRTSTSSISIACFA